jgi:hypothetical protein
MFQDIQNCTDYKEECELSYEIKKRNWLSPESEGGKSTIYGPEQEPQEIHKSDSGPRLPT